MTLRIYELAYPIVRHGLITQYIHDWSHTIASDYYCVCINAKRTRKLYFLPKNSKRRQTRTFFYWFSVITLTHVKKMEICEGNVVQHCKESFSQHKQRKCFVLFHPNVVYSAVGIAKHDFSSCVIELRREYKIWIVFKE